jgi:hypothetical protein
VIPVVVAIGTATVSGDGDTGILLMSAVLDLMELLELLTATSGWGG